MLVDETVASEVMAQSMTPFVLKLNGLNKVARDYAISYGATLGPWPIAKWFQEDQVEVSSYASPIFKDIFPQLGDSHYYRGFAIFEQGTDSGLKIYQPFMPNHPESCPPSLVALNTPSQDWLTPRLERLITKVHSFNQDLEKDSRVVLARRLDLYHGRRQK